MFDFLAGWFGRKGERATRLSKDEALAIARQAGSGDSLGRDLGLVTLDQSSGRLIWIVSSATVGRMLEISVDDETGEVLGIKHVGIR